MNFYRISRKLSIFASPNDAKYLYTKYACYTIKLIYIIYIYSFFLNRFYNKKQIFNEALNKLLFFFYNVNIFNGFK